MALVNIKSFSGVRPRVDARHLLNESAQVASGCHFYHGNLESLRQPLLTDETVIPDAKTIYKYLDQHWFSWSTPVDAVSSPVANDEWQRVYFTGDGYPKVTNNQIFAGANMPAAAYRLGVPAPHDTAVVGVTEDPGPLGEATPNDDAGRIYAHTYVTGAGEEGPPSAGTDVTVIEWPHEPGTFVTLNFDPPNTNVSNITHRRIYRSVTDADGNRDYLMVAEIPAVQSGYEDRLKDNQIGPSLETYDYEMPEQTMTGLTSMANGILFGHFGNTVCFSEANLPYAWPTDYQAVTDDEIVCGVALANTIAVLTKGTPSLFSGVSPDSMTERKLKSNQACVSKRSAIVVAGRLIYASPDGLVTLTDADTPPLTDKVITQEQWRKYQPNTIEAYCVEGRYVAFYGVALNKGFIFDPATGDLRHFDATAYCGFSSLVDDALYTSEGGNISQWEASNDTFNYLWRSKVFIARDAALACALIDGNNLHLTGWRLFVDGNEVLHAAPGELSGFGFWLPPMRGDRWEFELYGKGTVYSVTIAESMQELG